MVGLVLPDTIGEVGRGPIRNKTVFRTCIEYDNEDAGPDIGPEGVVCNCLGGPGAGTSSPNGGEATSLSLPKTKFAIVSWWSQLN